MTNKLNLPASYAVMNEEEMTYTAGGATMVQALCAWVVPFYGWYKGITAVPDYRDGVSTAMVVAFAPLSAILLIL